MNYDTHGNGVIDLVKLLKDVLDLRSAALHLAIDGRDIELANALDIGVDSEIYRLLGVHLTEARKKAGEAHTLAVETPGTLFDHIENIGALANADRFVYALKSVCGSYADVIEAMKGLHPLLFEQTTPELIKLLKEQEEKERMEAEDEQREATASADASS